MATTPVTGKIYLCKGVPLSNSYAHSIHFNTLAEQLAYFTGKANGELSTSDTLPSGKVVKVLAHQNYVKKDSGVIRIEVQEESNEDVNYLIWKTPVIGDNPPGDNYRWFFAFITDIVYVSNAVTELHYELDVLQTYAVQSNWNGAVSFKKCLIERRHATSDEVGEHIEPEPLSFSNQILQNRRTQNAFNTNYSQWRPLVFSSYNVVQGASVKIWGERGGLFQGLVCNVFKSFSALETYLAALPDASYNEFTKNIVCMIAAPAEFARIQGESDEIDWGVLDVNAVHGGNIYFPIKNDPSTDDIAGYQPNNNKLFTYPYNFMYVTNNEGSKLDLRYEFMKGITYEGELCQRFGFSVAIQPSFEIRFMPYGYGGVPIGNKDYDKSLSITDFPIVPWIADAYTQWLGTSKIGMYLSMLGSGAGIGASMAKGDALGIGYSAMNAVNSFGSYIDAQANAKMAADGLHTGSASALMVDGGKTLVSFQKCLNQNDAQRIDDFFTTFGYAENRIDTPNFTNGRKHQHYIKTTGCMVVGGCNAEYLRKIEQIFNNGVTWWNKNHIGEYN